MSSAGGRRRSLLANAIESIGTTPAPTSVAEVADAEALAQRLEQLEQLCGPCAWVGEVLASTCAAGEAAFSRSHVLGSDARQNVHSTRQAR